MKRKRTEKMLLVSKRVLVVALREAEYNLECASEDDTFRLYSRQVNQLRKCLQQQ